jgi:hypothetical protein
MQRQRQSLSAPAGVATALFILACLACLACLAGCGGATKDGGDSNTTPGADGFAPDDFETTMRWIAEVILPVAEADRQNNKLLSDERLETANAKLKELSGRKVSWRFKVKAVDEKQVTLAHYHLNAYKLRSTGTLRISALAEDKSPGTLPPGGNWSGQFGHVAHSDFLPDMEVGKVISKDHAKRLASGQVLVTGKIAYCVASGAHLTPGDSLQWGHRTIALCIVGAKCPE